MYIVTIYYIAKRKSGRISGGLAFFIKEGDK